MKITYVIRTANRYWGKGPTLNEAKKQCVKEGARLFEKSLISIVLTPDNCEYEPSVDGMGDLMYPAGATLVQLGAKTLGSVSSLK